MSIPACLLVIPVNATQQRQYHWFFLLVLFLPNTPSKISSRFFRRNRTRHQWGVSQGSESQVHEGSSSVLLKHQLQLRSASSQGCESWIYVVCSLGSEVLQSTGQHLFIRGLSVSSGKTFTMLLSFQYFKLLSLFSQT